MTLTPGESGSGASDQPLTLVPGRLEVLLGNFYYLEDRGALGRWLFDPQRRTPLIPENRLKHLSAALAEALADARPGEDVAVGVRGAEKGSSGSSSGTALAGSR